MDVDFADDSPVDFTGLFSKQKSLPKHHAKRDQAAKLQSTAKSKKGHKPQGREQVDKLRKRQQDAPVAEATRKKQRNGDVKAEGERRQGVEPGQQESKGDSQGHPTHKGFWPFEVDYLDHFETSFRAVQDIQPVLLALCQALKKKPSSLRVYDPFFCKGGIRRHYQRLGFSTFIHRNRDFYQDVASNAVPEYDILVTNPPYSADHKERILDYCLRSGRPWALLLPNYVATKAYYTDAIGEAAGPETAERSTGAVKGGPGGGGGGRAAPFYITPRVRYGYEHPEGTGHAESPFFSIWYVCLGTHTQSVYGTCRARLGGAAAAAATSRPGSGAGAAKAGAGKPGQRAGGAGDSDSDGGEAGGGEAGRGGEGGGGGGGGGGDPWDVSLVRDVAGLRGAGAVPTAKRLNPKQRQRLKKKAGQGGAG